MAGVGSILLIAGLFTSRALVDPQPIPYDSVRNPVQIAAAMVSASASVGWKARAVDAEHIDATYTDGDHRAEVEISVEAGEVRIRYVGSVNLSFSQDGDRREIHKVYLKWTQDLANAMARKIGALCPDFASLQADGSARKSFAELTGSRPELGSPARTFEVKSSSGARTGYLVRQYSAFLPPSPIDAPECNPVSVVFYNDSLVSVVKGRAELAALGAYTDILSFLVQTKQISFADAELERMSQEIDTVVPLDPPRRTELLRFVEWQADKFSKGEISKQEYDYVLAQKEAEVSERQGQIQAKALELELLRRQQAQQAASIDLQRQQLAAQRAQVISQALSNISASYRPSFNCTSSLIGHSVYTSCQ